MALSSSPALDSLADAIQQEETQRLRRFQNAWRAYGGNPPKPLRVRPGAPDDNILVNLCSVIVDKGVSALMTPEPTWVIEAAVEDSPETEYLEAAWEANQKNVLLHDLALNGGVTGHAFLKINPANEARGERFPRLIALDPATVFPTFDPHDLQYLWSYRIQYNILDPQTQRPFVFRQLIDRTPEGTWLITDQLCPPNSDSWTTTQVTTWPYPYCPVVQAKNLPNPNQFWGRSDIEHDTQHLNQVINRVLSNLNKIVRLHGHPKVWIKGAGDVLAGAWDVSIDAPLILPSKDAELGALQMLQDFKGPMDLLAALKESLYEVARTPEVTLGKLDQMGPVSGAALAILYGPLVEKTASKQLTYGHLLDETNRILLDMANLGRYEDLDVDTHFGAVVPADTLAQAQAAVMQQQVGISKRTLVAELGYDPDVEEANNQAAAAQALKLAQAQMAMQAQVAPPPTDPSSSPGSGDQPPSKD